MSGFYSDLDQIFRECISEFDQRITKLTLVRKVSAGMNPATREYEEGTPVEVIVNGITIPFAKRLVDGTAIQNGDIRVILDSIEKPEGSDSILIDGNSYGIVSVVDFNAGGVVIGYDLQVRI